MARIKSTISNPLHYERVIAIIKEARAREKYAHQDSELVRIVNRRLQALLAEQERALRTLADEKLELAVRLEAIDNAVKAIV